jgi:hypothetical protein
MPPPQFAYSLLTRSQRIGHENLRLRDPAWLRAAEDWFQEKAGGQKGRAPMFAPFRLRDMTLQTRIVVSPMAQYRAVDGCPTDWHFVHYAERAKGGVALLTHRLVERGGAVGHRLHVDHLGDGDIHRLGDLLVVRFAPQLGGEAVRAFAYTLGLGVVIGTISSIAIGAPMVWSSKLDEAAEPDGTAPAAA